MTTLTPAMQGLVLDTSAPFSLRNPMRHVVAEPDFVRALRDTVDDGEELLDAGLLDEGARLLFWTPFLLAAAIGYDGRVVHSLGDKVADFLDREDVEVSDEQLIGLGESLGIHEAAQYFRHNDRTVTEREVWTQAVAEVERFTPSLGLRMAFWVMCLRTVEYDLGGTRIPEAVREAARVHRAFAPAS